MSSTWQKLSAYNTFADQAPHPIPPPPPPHPDIGTVTSYTAYYLYSYFLFCCHRMFPLHQLKNKFMKKIPRDAEASNVLIGDVDFLQKPFVAFVRLAQATTLGGLTEVPVPTRWVSHISPY